MTIIQNKTLMNVRRINDLIKSNPEKEFTISEIVKEMGLSMKNKSQVKPYLEFLIYIGTITKNKNNSSGTIKYKCKLL